MRLSGIAASKVGATFGSLDGIARQIINKGLVNLALYDLKLMEISISHMV
jgi:Xaa-Pro aminopeptidase